MSKLIEKYIKLSLLLAVLPSVYFLIKRGFFEPHDLHHIADIYQMARAIVSGQLPPRLGPDFLYGFGYPLFNFYYLFPFYIGALFFFITSNLQFSFEAVFVLAAFISVAGMYLFLREFVGKWAAFVGSVLFIYTPYRAVQTYVRGAMGEAFALALFPLVAWFFIRLGRKPDRKLIIKSSFVLAVFILTHNYFWVLTLPWVFVLAVLLFWKNIKSVLVAYSKTILLSAGLTAFWWLPAIVENSLVASQTPFPLIDHFPFVKQLIVPSWGYGSSVWGPGDEISFQIGLVNLTVVALALLLFVVERSLKVDRKKKVFVVWAVVSFAVAFVFMNIRTYPVWKLLPFYDFIQFPWRLLVLTTFFSSVIAAVLVEMFKKKKDMVGWVIVLGSMFLTIGYFRPSNIVTRHDNDYLRRFFANRVIDGETGGPSSEHLNYSEDYLLLPKWVSRKPDFLPEKRFESVDLEIGEVKRLTSSTYGLTTKGDSGELVANLLYFPGWVAYVDGIITKTYATGPYGKVALFVPPGEHEVRIEWKETGTRLLADYLSLGTLVYILYLLVIGRVRRDEKTKK